jgi:hypothetical protein
LPASASRGIPWSWRAEPACRSAGGQAREEDGPGSAVTPLVDGRAAGGRGERLGRRHLDDGDGPAAEPASGEKLGEGGRGDAGAVGRIEKGEIAGRAGGDGRRRQPGGVDGEEGDMPGLAECPGGGIDGGKRPVVVVDEGGVRRAAGQCFEAVGTGPGADVDDAGADQARPGEAVRQDIEDRLSGPGGGGAKGEAVGDPERPSPVPSGDDPRRLGAAVGLRARPPAQSGRSLPSCSRSTFRLTSATSPSARLPSWNGP